MVLLGGCVKHYQYAKDVAVVSYGENVAKGVNVGPSSRW